MTTRPTRREVDQEQERSRHVMLASVAALLLLLRQRARRELPNRPQTAAEQLRSWLAHAYLIGRANAREAGYASLKRELELFEPSSVLRRPLDDIAYETWRAQRAARGYQRYWLKSWNEANSAAEADPFAVATSEQNWRLALGAETEVAAAFNEAREQSMGEWAAANPELALQYVRVWDSALEKNTCDVCAGAHGSWVPLGEDFPEGTPGQVHNRCQCTDHVEPIDWVDAWGRAA